ncbi:MAG: bacteriophage Gp15 family protein [Clostridiales bacterium]|nr:bacteriophage Gp15 family protein [Clostridiales bacterium]
MIYASFAAQYGIRLRREPDMTVAEYSALFSGLLPETPLGRVMAIRSENNPRNDYERGIIAEWSAFANKDDSKDGAGGIQDELRRLFGGKGGG